MRPRAIRALLAWSIGAAVLAAGCSGDDDVGTPSVAPSGEPGEGGTLVWAVADPVRTLDPLNAGTRSELILTRQIHEPLIESLSGPLGEARGQPGLARVARPSADQTVWTLKLREGVRFQDGEPFDATAVLANAERWQSSAVGRALLPSLLAVDAPSPGTVRFILSAPDPDLPQRLAAPELGIVSPEALADGLPSPRRATQAGEGTGTGAFELREASSDELLLARNTSWWGTAERLGPALEQVVLRIEPSGSVRVALLEQGDAQLADQLDSDQADFVASDPLLAVLPAGGGEWLGIERSVRGVSSAREIPSLAGAWLTTVSLPD